MVKKFFKCLKRRSCLEYAKNYLPILEWLPRYKLSYFPSDVVAGITVAIYNVPQAMAYAVLAGLPPIIGLYTSFFPPLLYSVFGTSSQVSVGMFSVTALMVGSVNDRMSVSTQNLTNGVEAKFQSFEDIHPVQVATAMGFSIGLVLGIMSLFRLHFVVAYMSDELVSGYTTGAACHVFATQLPKIFGLSLPRRTGFLKLYHVLKDIILSLKSTNCPDLITSLICIIFLHIGKWYVNPRVKKRSRVPLPFELFVIIIATVLSTVLNVKERFGMEIVSTIPTGFPPPALPKFSLISDVFFDSLVTAMVIFAITISVCKVFSKNSSSGISASQELFALSLLQLVTCFFSCQPACGSLTRTVINSHCGAHTQVSSIVAAGLMALAILWVAKLLTALPKCVLSAIIVVALQTMFLQIKQLKKLWKVSKTDMAIWLVSFLATVLWDVSQGLGVAVIFTLFTVIFRLQWPKSTQLVEVGEEGYYKEKKCYRTTSNRQHCENIVVYRFDAPLLFLNVDCFKRKTYSIVAQLHQPDAVADDGYVLKSVDDGSGDKKNGSSVQYLVLDASGFSEIDFQGVNCLKQTAKDLRGKGIEMLIADAKAHVLERFKLCVLEDSIPSAHNFPSVQNAVAYVMEKRLSPKSQISEDSETLLISTEKF